MKTVIYFFGSSKVWLLITACFFLFLPATAQEVQFRDPLNSAKGHWQLFTDATTRTTKVKFFDGKQNLLYEEELPEKYIRLTDRNINRINETFDLVTAKNLILTNVKANPLPPVITPRTSKHRNPVRSKTRHSASANAISNLKIDTYKVADTFKFGLIFQNPDRERIRINLRNEAGKILYTNFVNSASYERQFDFSGLNTEKYTLEVISVDRKQKYTDQIVIRSTPSTRSLDVNQFSPALITGN
ncbi:MAG: hypothetical protein M3142_11495 [Bacteroidota bacterium]|nr:hypothetical protein [Bacteroidota bacterium]